MSSQSRLDEMAAPLLDRQFAVTLPLNTIIASSLVYGVYVVIFSICVSAFRRPKKDSKNNRTNKLYIWSIFLLFGLVTVLTAVLIWHYYDQAVFSYDMARSRDYETLLEYLGHDDAQVARRAIISSLRAMINFIADLTMIHRCYTIWDSRKIIALPLLFASFCSTCIGLTGGIFMALGSRDASDDLNWSLYVKGNKMTLSVLVINAVVSFSVTLLTAGRIWFISHQIRRLYGQNTSPMYRRIIAIILESGFLCPLAITINLIITRAGDPDFKQSTPIDFSGVVYQIAGIAPTLVVARARAGKSIESVDRAVSTLQFATRQDIEQSGPHHLQQVSVSIRGSHKGRDNDASSISETWSRNSLK
uniref:Uncharacterized protein n=1 Tax=Moniliophthora roreri TaxID=221103 RepID=A0A0W0FDV9_MONRR